jgi:transcription factor YY
MASIVGSEVEIQEMVDIQIQEVEVEPVPVEMPVEIVETSVEGSMEIQPVIALQPLPEPAQEEIVLQSDDQVVVGNPNFIYVDNIPVPAPEIEVYVDDTLPSTSRKGKGGKKKVMKSAGFTNKGPVIETSMGEYTLIDPSSLGATNRKWEQKQVQIKTLEGEFSVTMWATGN